MSEPVAQYLTLLAYTLLKCGRQREANVILKAVVAAQPESIEALRLLAFAQLQCKQANACLQTLERFHRIAPDDAKSKQLTWIKIRALHLTGDSRKARNMAIQLQEDLSHGLSPAAL